MSQLPDDSPTSNDNLKTSESSRVGNSVVCNNCLDDEGTSSFDNSLFKSSSSSEKNGCSSTENKTEMKLEGGDAVESSIPKQGLFFNFVFSSFP